MYTINISEISTGTAKQMAADSNAYYVLSLWGKNKEQKKNRTKKINKPELKLVWAWPAYLRKVVWDKTCYSPVMLNTIKSIGRLSLLKHRA